MQLTLPILTRPLQIAWAILALTTVISEIAPNPHLPYFLHYWVYSPAKLIAFLALGFLVPLAFARLNNLNWGMALAALSAATIEILQGIIGNGHSFHWYELCAKLTFILVGFMLGLEARYAGRLSLLILRIQFLV